MATFEELLADLQAALNPAPSAPVPPPTTDLQSPINALAAGRGTGGNTDWISGPNRFAPQGGPEMRAYHPSTGEAAGGAVNRMLTPVMGAGPAGRVGGTVNRLLELGPVPAQMASEVAMQPVRAGDAWGDALIDPTPGNVGGAALETALTFAGPAGRGIRAGLTAAPRVTGAAVGGSAALAPSVASPQTATDEIKKLQERMQAAGYYSGPIDGVMGGGTRGAVERFQADEAQRQQAEIERQRAEAERAAAEAQMQQTQLQRETAEREAAQREEGSRRLREMDENTPWYREAWQDYGPYAGYALGMVGGGKLRGGLANRAARQSEVAAERANAMLATAGRGSVPNRIGNVNQFYTEGLRGAEAPFTRAPRRSPYPFQSNPNAPRAEQLYQPSEGMRAAADLAIPAVGGVERGVTEFALVRPAREELQAAQDAVAADPSESNIQRLMAARDKLAMAEGIANTGTGVILGSAAASVKNRIGPQSHTRPNVATAEAERGRLDALLNAPKKNKRKSR